MNVFLVLAHPEPKSFNGALHATAVETLQSEGHAVQTSELYAMGFNPLSDRHNFTGVKNPDYLKLQLEEMHATETGGFAPELEAEMRKLEGCDLLVLQFPLWWFGLPAILKGWVDRVFAMGRVYGGGRIYERGVFRGKRALVSTFPAVAVRASWSLLGARVGHAAALQGTMSTRAAWLAAESSSPSTSNTATSAPEAWTDERKVLSSNGSIA